MTVFPLRLSPAGRGRRAEGAAGEGAPPTAWAEFTRTRRSPRCGFLTFVALITLLPKPALACPSCATRESGGWTLYLLIALMIAVPYVIALVTLRVIRRLERDA